MSFGFLKPKLLIVLFFSAVLLVILIFLSSSFSSNRDQLPPASLSLSSPISPEVTFYEGVKPYIGVALRGEELASFFNVYRTKTSSGPWVLVASRFSGDLRVFQDFDYPREGGSVFYRVTRLDDLGRESAPSAASNIMLPITSL